MRAGFVKLRRGIIEHLEARRLTAEEFTVYSLVILLADHRTGCWYGSASALGRILYWSPRRCQKLLKSLRSKNYTSGACTSHAGAYQIKVLRYRGASVGTGGASVQTGGASVGATIEEGFQEHYQENPSARTSRRSPYPHKSNSKPQTGKQLEGLMEIKTQGGARKDYLEFIDLRDRNQLPKGMTWAKWEPLTPEERKKLLEGQRLKIA